LGSGTYRAALGELMDFHTGQNTARKEEKEGDVLFDFENAASDFTPIAIEDIGMPVIIGWHGGEGAGFDGIAGNREGRCGSGLKEAERLDFDSILDSEEAERRAGCERRAEAAAALESKRTSAKDRKKYLRVGDCVIHLYKGLAYPVTVQSSGNYLTSNCIRCVFRERGKLDPWYFCYLFNEAAELQQQKSASAGSSVTATLRLSLSEIKKYEVSLPPYELQAKLGDIYRQSLKAAFLLDRKKEYMKRFAFDFIDRARRGEDGEL